MVGRYQARPGGDGVARRRRCGPGRRGVRELIYVVTWLATGHTQFGQQGHAPSLHLPFLGIWFVLDPGARRAALRAADPALRARGPRPRGPRGDAGGGRERRADPPAGDDRQGAGVRDLHRDRRLGRARGPDRPDRLGARVDARPGRADAESRLRIIVACGAAGGIAATFNAPITGLFFGFEIVLREFSLDALFATSLAAVTGDVISRALFGSAPFFTQVPHDLVVPPTTPAICSSRCWRRRGADRGRLQDVLYGSRTSSTSCGRAARNGPAPRSAASRSVWCCSRCRRCTASAIR